MQSWFIHGFREHQDSTIEKKPQNTLLGVGGGLMYRKDTEPLYHSFMYSLESLLFGIYPLPAMHSFF